MLEIAAPARVPRAQHHLVPSRRWWLSWARWFVAAGDDGAARSSRVQMEAWRSDAMAGKPGPAYIVDLLFQEHARPVLAYLVHRLPTLPDAEDALDDVFLSALNACAGGQTLTGGWLMVTARRRIADFYRRHKRAVPLAAADAAGEQHAGESSEPEWVALRGEEHRELLRLVARLPPEQQEVLALRYAVGLQSPEIGAVVGKRADAVRALLARAMRRLREEWTR